MNIHYKEAYLLLALLFFQLLWLLCFPIFGDEAYFFNWGNQFSLGYYDHPPLTGMFAWLFNDLAYKAYWLRLVSFILSIYLTLILYIAAKRFVDDKSAILVALLFILPPTNLLMLPLYSNDILMTFLAAHFILAVYFSIKLSENDEASPAKIILLSFIAGLFLGLALLSKYFVGIYAIAYTAYLFLNYKKYQRYIFTGFPIVVTVSTIIFLTHLWWNYNNCAVNFAFHFFSRTRSDPLSGLAKTGIALLLTLSPFLLTTFFKKKFYVANWNISSHFFTFIFCFSLAAFILMGIIGGHFSLHWTAMHLAFFGSLMLVELANKHYIERAYYVAVRFTAAFFLILIVAISLLASSFDLLSKSSISKELQRLPLIYTFYSDIDSGALKKKLNNDFPGYDIVSSQYYIAETFTHHGIPTVALFNRSRYGRHNDIAIDYSVYDGHDFIIFRMPWRPHDAKYNNYFDEVEWITIDTPSGGSYPAMKGKNFNFELYRKEFILEIIDRHYSYDIPYANCYMDKYR